MDEATSTESGDHDEAIPDICLLELSASDDVDAFTKAVEVDGLDMNALDTWYCRQPGTGKMEMSHRTPLLISSLYGSLNVLNFILSKTSNVDVNARIGEDASTALHCAAAGGSSRAAEVVTVLLRHGARRDLMDAKGRRPAEVITISPKLPHVKSALERLLRPGSFDPRRLAPTLSVPSPPDYSPTDMGPSSPNSSSPQMSPKPSSPTSSASSGSEVSGSSTSSSNLQSSKAADALYPAMPPTPDGNNNSVYTSDDFRMYSFKIKPCSRAYSHDWTECPFVHPGENARRRDPRRYHYSCVPCPDFRKGTCRRGDTCEYAHGVFECWLHPAQYRTRLCKDGTGCARRVCFFAHTSDELRPLFSPAVAASTTSFSSSSSADMLSVAASPDLPPPSPSSVLILSQFSSSAAAAAAAGSLHPGLTPPMSPSVRSAMQGGGGGSGSAAAAAGAWAQQVAAMQQLLQLQQLQQQQQGLHAQPPSPGSIHPSSSFNSSSSLPSPVPRMRGGPLTLRGGGGADLSSISEGGSGAESALLAAMSLNQQEQQQQRQQLLLLQRQRHQQQAEADSRATSAETAISMELARLTARARLSAALSSTGGEGGAGLPPRAGGGGSLSGSPSNSGAHPLQQPQVRHMSPPASALHPSSRRTPPPLSSALDRRGTLGDGSSNGMGLTLDVGSSAEHSLMGETGAGGMMSSSSSLGMGGAGLSLGGGGLESLGAMNGRGGSRVYDGSSLPSPMSAGHSAERIVLTSPSFSAGNRPYSGRNFGFPEANDLEQQLERQQRQVALLQQHLELQRHLRAQQDHQQHEQQQLLLLQQQQQRKAAQLLASHSMPPLRGGAFHGGGPHQQSLLHWEGGDEGGSAFMGTPGSAGNGTTRRSSGGGPHSGPLSSSESNGGSGSSLPLDIGAGSWGSPSGQPEWGGLSMSHMAPAAPNSASSGSMPAGSTVVSSNNLMKPGGGFQDAPNAAGGSRQLSANYSPERSSAVKSSSSHSSSATADRLLLFRRSSSLPSAQEEESAAAASAAAAQLAAEGTRKGAGVLGTGTREPEQQQRARYSDQQQLLLQRQQQEEAHQQQQQLRFFG